MNKLKAFIFAVLLCPLQAMAQEAAPTFSQEELDQLTAPIALYPDTLLSQVLMAATYPADVAEAAKWSKQNTKQKGDDAVKAVDSQPWDPSVKALVAFPQVLAMMAERPDWVQNLGDAFLASSKNVLDSVQRLRAKAQEAGNLKSNEQQKIVVQQQPAQPQVIVIEAADPQVVYVPSYNPTVVYGQWPYPAYPPYYYPPPPAYYPGTALASGIAFGIGVAAVSSLWGNCNWGHGDVDINVNRYNNINVNNRINANQNTFQHNAANRRGVPYRDAHTQQQFGKNLSGAENRASYRGRDSARDAQRQQAQSSLQQRGMDPSKARDQLRNDPQARQRAQNAARNTDNKGLDHNSDGGINQKQGADQRRAENSARDRMGDANRKSQQQIARGANDSAFREAGNGRQTQQQIDRGNASRQQMSQHMNRSGGGVRAGRR